MEIITCNYAKFQWFPKFLTFVSWDRGLVFLCTHDPEQVISVMSIIKFYFT